MPTDLQLEQRQTALRILPQLLYNPFESQGVTCEVCWEPVGAGATFCHVCRDSRHAFGDRLADYVLPLTYASDSETPQIRRFLKIYKDGYSDSERATASSPLSYLVWLFSREHHECVSLNAGGPISGLVVVPSGRVGSRPDAHPIDALARYFPPWWRRTEMVRVRDAISRQIDPESLQLDPDEEVQERHFVVFDDTWTTGASAQSAAVVLKRAGAASVTIIVIGRWVNSSWSPTREFFEARPHVAWSSEVCPVTGSACPPPI